MNFGPIDSANIQLTNCSFFAGKNNVGKSVMAQLMYCIVKVVSPTLEEVSRVLPELVENEFLHLMDEVVRTSGKTKASTKKSPGKSKAKPTKKPPQKTSGAWKVSQRDLKRITQLARKRNDKIKERINTELSSFAHEAMKEKMLSEIRYVFSSSIYDYIRLGEDTAKMLFEYEDNIFHCIYTLGIYRKSQSTRSETGVKVKSEFLDRYLQEMFKLPIKHLKGKSIRYSWEKGKLTVKFPSRMAGEKIRTLPSETFRPWNTYYIPSGRAGLLEGYKVVSSAFYMTAPSAFMEDNKPPSISGVVADYYSLLMNFEGRKGHYNKVAKDLLSRTMEGQVEMDSDEYPFSVMKYRLRTSQGDETEIDITKASSMVKELAPLYMVVSEKLKPNDLLIIEEPESHLQSKTQLELAEFFFNLSKEGVRILITTHSELMLRQSFQLFNQKDIPISGNLFIFKVST